MTLILTGILAATAVASAVELRMTEDMVGVYEQDQAVLAYRYHNTPKKPYLMEWYTPGGVNVLRDAPADHLHHHGLMFAITVEDVNFWEESAGGGAQAHRGFTEMRVMPADNRRLSVIGESLHWHAPESEELLLLEDRRVSPVRAADTRARLLSWQSRLRCPDARDSVTLSGKIYHGLGMRFPAVFDSDGVFRWADDKNGAFRDGIHYLARASWCAVTVETGDQTLTVAMFDHPDNPRPALWFTMDNPFAYLSGTLDLSREPLSLAADEVVTLRYGVAAWDVVAEDAAIEAMYRDWLTVETE